MHFFAKPSRYSRSSEALDGNIFSQSKEKCTHIVLEHFGIAVFEWFKGAPCSTSSSEPSQSSSYSLFALTCYIRHYQTAIFSSLAFGKQCGTLVIYVSYSKHLQCLFNFKIYFVPAGFFPTDKQSRGPLKSFEQILLNLIP